MLEVLDLLCRGHTCKISMSVLSQNRLFLKPKFVYSCVHSDDGTFAVKFQPDHKMILTLILMSNFLNCIIFSVYTRLWNGVSPNSFAFLVSVFAYPENGPTLWNGTYFFSYRNVDAASDTHRFGFLRRRCARGRPSDVSRQRKLFGVRTTSVQRSCVDVAQRCRRWWLGDVRHRHGSAVFDIADDGASSARRRPVEARPVHRRRRRRGRGRYFVEPVCRRPPTAEIEEGKRQVQRSEDQQQGHQISRVQRSAERDQEFDVGGGRCDGSSDGICGRHPVVGARFRPVLVVADEGRRLSDPPAASALSPAPAGVPEPRTRAGRRRSGQPCRRRDTGGR